MARPSLAVAALCLALTTPLLAGSPRRAQSPVRMGNPDCRPCGGPAECAMDKAQADRLRAAKRAVMLHDYPARIVDKLLAPLPNCFMCLWGPDEQSPMTGVQILDVERSGRKSASMDWSKEGELIARKHLEKGQSKAFYFVHQAEACTCCVKGARGWERSGLSPKKRRDWDNYLQFNKDMAVKFESARDLGPEPAELKSAANYNAFK